MSWASAVKVITSAGVSGILIAIVAFGSDYLVAVHGMNRIWEWLVGGILCAVILVWTIWLANHLANKDMAARGWSLEEIGDDYEEKEKSPA
jgi:hypothetical protein